MQLPLKWGINKAACPLVERFPRRVALALVLYALCAAAAPAPSATAQKRELTELRDRIDTLQKRLAESEETKSEAVDALRESELAISDTNRALRDLGEQQRAVNARLSELKLQSSSTSKEIEAHQSRLARLLYQQYTGAQPDAIKLWLNRDDPNEVARQMHYLTYLSRARAQTIRKLRASLTRLSDLSGETERQGAELNAIHAEQRAQRKRLEDEKHARKEVLVKVSRQIEPQRREISTLKRDENRLARLVDQLTRMLAARPKSPTVRNERVPELAADRSPFAQLRGRLNLPVRGELRNRFGVPREDSGLLWKGLFIAAPVGNEVKAIAAGRVVFADWLRGFGNLLIVDHSGGYMSLYGNNESLFKQVGADIRAGEAVAAVGNSGGNPDSGLYFEMRHQGKPFDPLGWVVLK